MNGLHGFHLDRKVLDAAEAAKRVEFTDARYRKTYALK